MKVETHMQSVTITEIPNAENLTSVSVNLQDMVVELLYKGYEHRPIREYVRYDGELDPPGMPPRQPEIGGPTPQPEGGFRPGASAPQADYMRPRAVRDSPQA